MILSNLYKIWGANFMYSSLVKARNMSGNEVTVCNTIARAAFYDFEVSSGAAIWFGYGTTEPTFDDYNLEHRYDSSNLVDNNYLTPTNTYEPSTGVITRTQTFILTNNRTSALTVNEVGISIDGVLIYREVLSSSKRFTVAAGETIKYTHTLRFTVPTTSDE